MPWIGFVFAMGHLSINQLARQFANAPGVVDITGAQMVMVMKLTSFCWNVADGRLPEKDLSPYQQERAIKKLPSPLNFAGYVLFFPSLFAGPSFDYVDYRRWIETTMFEVPSGVDASKKPPTRKKRKIPRSGTPAAWKAAAGLFWIFAFLKLSGWYYPELLTGDKFMTFGISRRIWILHMLGVTARLKYYGVWALTEGSCILSGMGYKGVDPVTGKVAWDRLQNVNPWGVESAQNTRAYLGSWNMNTNNWLRNYMYLRVTPKGKKPGFRASMATFVTSAFWRKSIRTSTLTSRNKCFEIMEFKTDRMWKCLFITKEHANLFLIDGFFPGYYLAFILASFIQTVAKSWCALYSILDCMLTTFRLPTLLPALLP